MSVMAPSSEEVPLLENVSHLRQVIRGLERGGLPLGPGGTLPFKIDEEDGSKHKQTYIVIGLQKGKAVAQTMEGERLSRRLIREMLPN